MYFFGPKARASLEVKVGLMTFSSNSKSQTSTFTNPYWPREETKASVLPLFFSDIGRQRVCSGGGVPSGIHLVFHNRNMKFRNEALRCVLAVAPHRTLRASAVQDRVELQHHDDDSPWCVLTRGAMENLVGKPRFPSWKFAG